jgi:hypothetical protein
VWKLKRISVAEDEWVTDQKHVPAWMYCGNVIIAIEPVDRTCTILFDVHGEHSSYPMTKNVAFTLEFTCARANGKDMPRSSSTLFFCLFSFYLK